MRRVVLAVVGILVLAGGAWFADQAVTSAVERRVARAIATATEGDADVVLRGWPVGVRMLAGVIPQADISVRDAGLPEAPAHLSSLEATLYDVDVDWRGERFVRGAREGHLTATFADLDLPDARLRRLRLVLPSVSGSLEGLEDPAVPLVVHAPGGRFEAELSDEDVTAMLGVPRLGVEVGDGYVALVVGPLRVDAAAVVEEGAIVLRPRQQLLALVLRDAGSLALRPRLPPTAVLTDIELRPGVVRLFGTVDRLELPAAREP